MTCIVGVEWAGEGGRGVVMAADSLGAAGHFATEMSTPKLFRLSQRVAEDGESQQQEMLIGYTSSYRMGQLLRWELDLPFHPAGMPDEEWLVTRFLSAVRSTLEEGGWLRKKDERERSGFFLVGYRGRLYHVERELQVMRSADGYQATGSGQHVAAGAIGALTFDAPVESRLRAHGIVELALTVAERHTTSVRRPWRTEELTVEDADDES